jgi:hypothetical protein
LNTQSLKIILELLVQGGDWNCYFLQVIFSDTINSLEILL